MISILEYSQLLRYLYAAPLQPEKWQDFFGYLSKLTNLSIGTLSAIDGECAPVVLAGGGFAFNGEAVRQYNEYYSRFDPFAVPLFRFQNPEVLNGEQLLSHDRVVKTEFYDGFLSKNQMEFLTVMSISNSQAGRSFMTLWRRARDGALEADSLSILNMLMPHAQIALQLRSDLRDSKVHDYLEDLVFECFGLAAFLLSASRTVLHMNKLAAGMVLRREGLSLNRGILTAKNPRANERLGCLVSGAAKTRGIGGVLSIPLADKRKPLSVSVLPLPEKCSAYVGMPSALVLAISPTARPAPREAMLRELYALTPTECRLAGHLLSGLDLKTSAEIMKITRETARFHMKRLLSKSGTHSQSELIRLMLLLPPFPSDDMR